MGRHHLIRPHMIRAMKNDSETGWRNMDESAGVVGPAVPVARKPNTSYGMADFHRIMIAACVLGVSALGTRRPSGGS